MSDITLILHAIRQGDARATSQLLPAVYEELRRLARQQMGRERADHTLQPTALVHEAFLRLGGSGGGDCPEHWDSRGHFFAAASEAMRRILIDHARQKQALRRGGHRAQVTLDDAAIDLIASPCASPEELLDLNDAIDRLETANPAWAQLAKLIVFAGLNLDEAASSLGISRPTAYRYWTFARAWLHDAVRGENTP